MQKKKKKKEPRELLLDRKLLLMINSGTYLGCLLYSGVPLRIYNSCNRNNLSLSQRNRRERIPKTKKEREMKKA